MPKHLSVRMAWHDNKWNGRVCRDPEGNFYCSGTHSLLSERLARNKNTEIEKIERENKIDQIQDYLPPCFWSANAFAVEPAQITHVHPFPSLREKAINEKLKPYSVLSWPFRLSFNHSKQKRSREGYYPKDLESRIESFREWFEVGKSLIFFYLNYDNPVSADDYKRALVGCSVLSSKIAHPPHFDFSHAELSQWQKKDEMQNFPTVNWAFQISHDYE